MGYWSKSEVELINASPKSFLGAAIPVVYDLGWTIEEMYDDEIVCQTGGVSGQKVTVFIKNGRAYVESKSALLIMFLIFSFFDFGKNRENIKSFVAAYSKSISSYSISEYEKRFNEALKLWSKK